DGSKAGWGRDKVTVSSPPLSTWVERLPHPDYMWSCQKTLAKGHRQKQRSIGDVLAARPAIPMLKGVCLEPLREPEKIMRKFLLWDQDGVLVDTERWFFIATQECLGELDVELDQATYLQYMAAGRSYWELALDHGRSDVVIAEKRRERDRRYQSYLATKDITIDGVLETLHALCQQYRMAIVSTSTRADVALIHRSHVL